MISIVPASGASTVTPRTDTSRGLFGSNTVPSAQRSPSLGVQLDRHQAGEVRAPACCAISTISMPRSRAAARALTIETPPDRIGRSTPAAALDAEDVGAAALGERAVVAHAERLDPRRAHLRRRSPPELIGQPDPRLQALQLVGLDRRKVHGVAHHAVAQEVAHRRGGVEADQFLRLLGRRRDVRRRDHLRQLRQRPVGRRLLLEHVEAGAGDDAAARSRGAAPPRRSARRARC